MFITIQLTVTKYKGTQITNRHTFVAVQGLIFVRRICVEISRLIIDEQQLNRMLIYKGYPLPVLDGLIHVPRQCKVFTRTDLSYGYRMSNCMRKSSKLTTCHSCYGRHIGGYGCLVHHVGDIYSRGHSEWRWRTGFWEICTQQPKLLVWENCPQRNGRDRAFSNNIMQ